MRSPSPRCFPNVASWYQIDPQYDQDGSPLPTSYPNTPTVSGIPCSCQLQEAVVYVEQQGQVTAHFEGWVEFGVVYPMTRRDKIIVTLSGITHTLFVIGLTDGAGRGSIFGVQVEEEI